MSWTGVVGDNPPDRRTIAHAEGGARSWTRLWAITRGIGGQSPTPKGALSRPGSWAITREIGVQTPTPKPPAWVRGRRGRESLRCCRLHLGRRALVGDNPRIRRTIAHGELGRAVVGDNPRDRRTIAHAEVGRAVVDPVVGDNPRDRRTIAHAEVGRAVVDPVVGDNPRDRRTIAHAEASAWVRGAAWVRVPSVLPFRTAGVSAVVGDNPRLGGQNAHAGLVRVAPGGTVWVRVPSVLTFRTSAGGVGQAGDRRTNRVSRRRR